MRESIKYPGRFLTGMKDDTQNAAVEVIKPRILTVGMHLTKTRGGITTLIAEILKSPLKDDFEFQYVSAQAEDFDRFRKFLLAAQAVSGFLKKCVRRSPDLVYVHFGGNASLYREGFFVLLAKILRIKTVGHFHAGDVENYYPFQNAAGRRFIRTALKSCDAMIVVSKESARQLLEIVPSAAIKLIPNAIETSAFDFKREAETDKFVRLLFVGAIGKLKGERDLLAALSILREQNLPLKVSILGYGAENLRAICEELKISHLIEFLGAVSMDERLDYYRRADIFVLPTYAEAMPMSVIEAMAAGLPVISTRVGGIPELIDDRREGLLFEPGNVAALASHIAELVADEPLRKQLGANGRRKAQNEFDFKEYAAALRDYLFQQI